MAILSPPSTLLVAGAGGSVVPKGANVPGVRRGAPTPDRVNAAERREKAVALAIKGWPYQKIADELGYASRGAAHQAVSTALKERIDKLGQTVDAYREQETERLTAVLMKVWQIMETPHPLVQGGKVVLDQYDVPMLDDGPSLAAAAQIVRISESLRKLHGTDQPAKVNISGTVQHSYGVDIEDV